jgi:RNA polymerase sigma-70 factor (ECF subfamily)
MRELHAPVSGTPEHVGYDDSALVTACARGEEWALRALIERHAARLFAVCLRVTGNEDDALDALQEVWWAAWRGAARFDHRSKVSTWLHRIAVNEAIDARNRSRRAPLPVDSLPEVAATNDHEQTLDRLAIEAAVKGVPHPFRTAVVLRDLHDLSYEQIAATLDIKLDTVKSRICRGRRACAAALTGHRS